MKVVVCVKQVPDANTPMALDPETHRIYLPAVQYEAPKPDAAPNARPTAIVDSMRILVYGMK